MGLAGSSKVEVYTTFVLVAIGGAIGAVLRYAVMRSIDDTEFPWAIFLVNIIGCTVAAFVIFRNPGTEAYTFIVIGVLGAFTTMSSFTSGTVSMLYDQEYLKLCCNVLLNVGVCLLGAIIGRYIALTF